MSKTKIRLIVGASVAVVAILGSIFTAIGQPCYATLTRPSQWPPNFLFPVVWTAIYAIAFFALGFAFTNNRGSKRLLIYAAINGALNMFWCLVFFTLHQIFLGEVLIIFNLVAAILLVSELQRNFSAWFYPMLLYPLWLAIANALNLAIWILQ